MGKGDFIGEQFVADHEMDEVVTIAETKQSFTEVWNQYNVNSVYDSLKTVVERSSGKTAGEYLFPPVVLSASVRDALLQNGYKKDQFLYVPELVLETISRAADRK